MRRFTFTKIASATAAALGLLTVSVAPPVAAEIIRVVDQRGKVVELSSRAERIVVIPIPMASVVMALDGSASRLVGIHPAARKSIEDGFLKRIYPEALTIRSDIVRGGQFNPNLESILELRPDLVIQWDNPADLIKPLEGAGITVAGLTNSPPTQEGNERNLAIIGALLGKTERLETILGWQRRHLAAISAITATIPDEEKPKALYFRAVQDSLRPVGAGVYQDFWINLVGARNAAGGLAGMQTAVNVEQIAAWNPDIIFIGAFDNGRPEDLLSNPALAGVAAVRNRRVYKLPHGGYRWDPGSHESHLTWLWTSMLVHPERFAFDLRAEMIDSYRFLYNHEPTQEEIDDILGMEMNRGMANYDRFAR